MIIHKVTDHFPLILPEPKMPRSPGIHVSNIIRCIATEAGFLKPEWAEELSLVDVRRVKDRTAILRIRIGLAWEEHYLPTIPGVVDHPGEVQIDGVYMTHDAESISSIIRESTVVMQDCNSYTPAPTTLFVHEVKATYKSTNTVKNLIDEWMWLTQIKAYCKALDTLYAFLHVLFLCGDYSYPIKPILEIWQIEFTPEEIAESWELLTGYVKLKEAK